MRSPRDPSSSMSSDSDQQADELPNINISEEPTVKKPLKSILKKYDDPIYIHSKPIDIPGTSDSYYANASIDSANKKRITKLVESCVDSFHPKGATAKAILELAAVRTLTRDVVIVSIGKYAMEMAESAIENLGKFNILNTFVFAGHDAKKSTMRCEFFNAPKEFKISCFPKDYVNPTDRLIEELQKYDQQYHEEMYYEGKHDKIGQIMKVYPKFIFLISQGGEDYFFSSREPVMEGEQRMPLKLKIGIVSIFKDHSATKEQLVVVRKILSRVKAGGIINYIKNGFCHGLYMPESLDDEMADISGGPTIYPEYADERDAVMEIMKNLGMKEKMFNEFQWSQLETPNDYYDRPGRYQNQNQMIVSVPLLLDSIRETLFHYDTSTPFGYKKGSTKNIGRLFTEMLCSQHLEDTALMRTATSPLPTKFPMALISGGEFGPMDVESGGEDFKSTTPIQELMLDCLMAFGEKEPAYEFTLTCVATSGEDGTSGVSGIVISNEDVKRMKEMKKRGEEISYSSPSEFWFQFSKEEDKIEFKGHVDMGTIFVLTLEKSFEEERKRCEEMDEMTEMDKIEMEGKRKLNEMVEEARRNTVLAAERDRKERHLEREKKKKLREEQMEEVENKKKKRKRNDKEPEDREQYVEFQGSHDNGEEQSEELRNVKEEGSSNPKTENKNGPTDELPRGDADMSRADELKDSVPRGDGNGESNEDQKRLKYNCLKCGTERDENWRWVRTARKCNSCGETLLYKLPKKGQEKEDQDEEKSEESCGNDEEEREEDRAKMSGADNLLHGDGVVWDGNLMRDPRRKREEEIEEVEKKKKRKRNDEEPEDREQHVEFESSHGDNNVEERNEEHQNVEVEDSSNPETENKNGPMDDADEEEVGEEEKGEEDTTEMSEADSLLRGDGTVWPGNSRYDPRRKTEPKRCFLCGRRKENTGFMVWISTARKYACNRCDLKISYNLQKKGRGGKVMKGDRQENKIKMDELLRGDGTVWNENSRQDPRRKTEPKKCLKCGTDKGKQWRWISAARKWACVLCNQNISYYVQSKRRKGQRQRQDDEDDGNEEEKKVEVEEEEGTTELDKLLRGDGTVWKGQLTHDPRRKIKPRMCLKCGTKEGSVWIWISTARKWSCDQCGRFIKKYQKKKATIRNRISKYKD